MKAHPVNWLHIFFTGPLLIYVGLVKPTHPWIYLLLGLLGGLILLKFAWYALTTPWSERHIWFALHGMLFSFLLMYVGWKGTQTEGTMYSLLLAVGIAAFGYHLVRVIQKNI